jgi:hypothetical protein
MEWLNMHTSILHAPEYIGSDPTARATWLNVSMWSAQQENGGRIEGAKGWGNRQWQQTCGVTRREIESAARLLTWEGEALIVWRYPKEKEDVVRKKRGVGQLGGLKSGAVRRNKAEATLEPPAEPYGSTEGKGIGREEEWRARGGLPNSLNTPTFAERWESWQRHWSQTFNYGNPMPEMTAHQQLTDLATMGETRAISAINNSLAKGTLKRPLEPYQAPDARPETIVTTF